MKLVPPRIALPFTILVAATLGGAVLTSRVLETRRSEAAAVTDGWRALAAAEHLAAGLRKAEAVCVREFERAFAFDATGCSASFGLTASAVEDVSALQRRDLGQADRRALERHSLGTGLVVATYAALLLLIVAAALGVRGHLREREGRESEQRHALELQQRLMGIVGHDLRTPLNAIAGSAALLARAADLPTARLRAAQRIVSSAARMSGLVRDLLDYTRLRVSGGFSIEPEPAHLGEIGRAVAQEVRSAWQGSVIELSEAGDLQGRWDPVRIEQVLSNLIGNACHHGTPGAPVLVQLSGTKAAVRAEVHNEGPPIPPEVLPLIFEPFRRGASARRDASGGVGLGLFIVRSLVEAHGGTIEVATGQAGTTFMLELPRAPPAELQR